MHGVMGIPDYVICLLHLALALLAVQAARKNLRRKAVSKMVARALGALGVLAALYHAHMLYKRYGPKSNAQVQEMVKKSEAALAKMSKEVVELP